MATTALIARRLGGGRTRDLVLASVVLTATALVRPTEATVLAGAIVFPSWIIAVSLVLGAIAGFAAGVLAFVALPALGLFTLGLREQWAQARAEASRYLTLRRRREAIEPLREQQRELAIRLKAVLEQHSDPARSEPQPRSHASAAPHREQ